MSGQIMSDEELLGHVIATAIKAHVGPLMERLATAETRATEAERRLAEVEARPLGTPDAVKTLEEWAVALRVRLEALEARHPVVGPAGRDGIDGKDGTVGVNGKDGRDGVDGKDGRDGQNGLSGRDGKDGLPGKDGADGAAGKDGLGFDDLSIEIGERAFDLVFTKGDRVKRYTVPVHGFFDKGVYRQGEIYQNGDGVSYGGSFWIAQTETSEKPGDGAKGWRLAVKRGRDGAEGKAGPVGPKGDKGDQGEPGRIYR